MKSLPALFKQTHFSQTSAGETLMNLVWLYRAVPAKGLHSHCIDGYSISYQYEKILKLSYISNGSFKEQCRDVSVVQKNRYLRKCLLIRVLHVC